MLHISPNIFKSTALDENGNLVNGRGDRPNAHDILTGTQADGTAYFPRVKEDRTCSNWTSSGEGSATVGHHDRHGGGNTSWNAAHNSRGCSQENLQRTGGQVIHVLRHKLIAHTSGLMSGSAVPLPILVTQRPPASAESAAASIKRTPRAPS